MPPINAQAVEKLEKIRSGELPYPPMWETVPVSLVEIGEGRVVMRTRADERHINALGSVHGGYAATVLDTALGLTVFVSLDEEAARHVTVDLAVKLVRAIPLETDLTVSASLVHLSRRLGVSQAELHDAAGTVYAHGTTTCLITR